MKNTAYAIGSRSLDRAVALAESLRLVECHFAPNSLAAAETDVFEAREVLAEIVRGANLHASRVVEQILPSDAHPEGGLTERATNDAKLSQAYRTAAAWFEEHVQALASGAGTPRA